MEIVTVRASSWGSLFNCAYAWEGVHLLGIKSPSSPCALLGTAMAETEDAAAQQAEALLALGPANVLVKGGHGTGDDSVDILIGKDGRTHCLSVTLNGDKAIEEIAAAGLFARAATQLATTK